MAAEAPILLIVGVRWWMALVLRASGMGGVQPTLLVGSLGEEFEVDEPRLVNIRDHRAD